MALFSIKKFKSHEETFNFNDKIKNSREVFMPLCQVDFSTKPSFWKALRPPAKDKVGLMT